MMMPFSDIFGVSEMGNIPGVSEMPAYDSNNLLDIEKSDKHSYPNWRKKLHIPIEHMEEVDKFQEIVAILNKYRSDGNDGKGRYYQFKRLGNNKPSTIDFSRAYSHYKILASKERYQLSQLLESRYGPHFRGRLGNRKQNAVKRYNDMVAAYLEKQGRVG